jgi:hypothetical protein
MWEITWRRQYYIKEGGDELKKHVLNLMNKCWNESKVPDIWGHTIITPIYKGKGDPGKCENYRGISLMSHLAKTYERILEARLRKKVEPQLDEEQYGYRKSRSTTDFMFALRMVVEKSL